MFLCSCKTSGWSRSMHDHPGKAGSAYQPCLSDYAMTDGSSQPLALWLLLIKWPNGNRHPKVPAAMWVFSTLLPHTHLWHYLLFFFKFGSEIWKLAWNLELGVWIHHWVGERPNAATCIPALLFNGHAKKNDGNVTVGAYKKLSSFPCQEKLSGSNLPRLLNCSRKEP